MGAQGKKARSLEDFAKAKVLTECKVCQLPAAVLKEIKGRRPRITMQVIVEWLKTEHGVTITTQEFRAHGVGNHGWDGVHGR